MAYDKSKYAEKLRDPRWQKKRLEVFNRDKWSCCLCGDDESTLSVHHKVYENGKEPWDYDNDYLMTLCQPCHEIEYAEMQGAIDIISTQLKLKFSSSDIWRMSLGIANMKLLHASEVVASAYEWAFENPEIQQELIDKYFDQISVKP